MGGRVDEGPWTLDWGGCAGDGEGDDGTAGARWRLWVLVLVIFWSQR